ncbi:MAG: SWIM zinc finger family protein [Acidobacteria bacterium]|nr:SWIM zinc finger family protein [Acidobacteriota bacterium]
MNTAIKNLNVRTKRAKLIAEMGLIVRDEHGFNVKSPSNHNDNLRVWRDEKGRVRCSCTDFEKNFQEDARFRCEHILAVKYFLEPLSENSQSQQIEEVTETINIAQEPLAQNIIEKSFEQNKENENLIVSSMKQNDEINVVSSMKQINEISTVSPVKQRSKSTNISPMKQETLSEDKLMKQNTNKVTEEVITPVLTPDLIIMEETMDKTMDKTSQDNFVNILKELSAPISRELIRQRFGWTDKAGVDHEIDYIEWHTVADMLDRIYPRWSHAVKEVRQIGELVAITASITIMGVTREGVGTGSAYDEIGIKKAEHDALKRAAVKFGIARDLYKHTDEDLTANGQPLRFPRDPVAKNIAEMATTKQHAAIRAIANANGVDAETLCQELFNCKVAELSRRAASTFIDHLKNVKQSISA